MKLEKIPFWLRYRPNSLEKSAGKIPIILLPRIKKIIDGDSIELNFLFYGCGGTGKSVLAEILTENTDCLRLNCSSKEERGIDIISEKLHDHCTKYGMFGGDKQKTVFLDEFDGSTPQLRDALRSYIEGQKHVRFIATANNLARINRTEQDKALLSRFTSINFDPIDDKEKQFMLINQLGFLKGLSKKESFEVSDDILKKILHVNYPNFRLSVQHLQELIKIGDFETFEEIINQRSGEIFEYILNGNNELSENYSFVMDNYKDKTDELLKMLGRSFFVYLSENKPEFITSKGQSYLKMVKQYNAEYYNALDPELHLFSFITELKELFKK